MASSFLSAIYGLVSSFSESEFSDFELSFSLELLASLFYAVTFFSGLIVFVFLIFSSSAFSCSSSSRRFFVLACLYSSSFRLFAYNSSSSLLFYSSILSCSSISFYFIISFSFSSSILFCSAYCFSCSICSSSRFLLDSYLANCIFANCSWLSLSSWASFITTSLSVADFLAFSLSESAESEFDPASLLSLSLDEPSCFLAFFFFLA